jgi:hypothetical protein
VHAVEAAFVGKDEQLGRRNVYAQVNALTGAGPNLNLNITQWPVERIVGKDEQLGRLNVYAQVNAPTGAGFELRCDIVERCMSQRVAGKDDKPQLLGRPWAACRHKSWH